MGSQKRIPIKQAIELARIISEQFDLTTCKKWMQFIGRELRYPGKSFLLFEQARKHARSLNLKSMHEWRLYCDENHIVDIPSHPAKHYKNDWISWGDFLGAKAYLPSKFLNYEDARLFVQSIKPRITNCKEWDKYCKSGKRPKNIPHSPQKIYKDKWIGWNYFFGVGLYRPDVEEGKIFSDEELRDDIEFDIDNLESMEENFREEFDTDEEILEAYKDEPPRFVAALKQYLKDHPRVGGEENLDYPGFLNYEDARLFVKKIKPKITNCKEWDKYCKSGKKPSYIPNSPQKVYKEKWLGWDVFFTAGMYSSKMSDKEIQWEIVQGKAHIGEEVDALRGDMTDEEIIEAYKQEAPDIINALKKYLKKYPREENE